MDDVGASTKLHERYCENRFLNVGFLRDRRLFGAWGPYREMVPAEWESIFSLLEKHNAKLTVAVTGCWVEASGELIPFPEKFPEEAAALKAGLASGRIEIASHGLTHCVLADKKFLPRLFGSNRTYHREFWDWVPAAEHTAQLKRSVQILRDYFGQPVTTLIPPGNVYAPATLAACRENGIRLVNCQNPRVKDENPSPRIVGNEHVIAFHDREIVLEGVEWLERALRSQAPDTEYRFVGEL